MADLATLQIRVDATGAMTAVDKFGTSVKGAAKQTDAFSKTMGTLKKSLAGLVGIGTVTLALKKLVAETSTAQAAQAQLAAVLKSTGGAAGQTADALNKHAAALQRMTAFGDDAVVQAQAMLLTFTKIQGDTFPKATEAVLNVATAMGSDLQSAAIQVGKALNDPILGVTALARSGIQFTESQKATIKTLVETGQTAKAQTLILKELETQFGGSAKAARETLGGALAGLNNAFGDLFEISSQGSRGMVRAINAITDALPKLRDAIDNTFGAMFAYFDRVAVRLRKGELGIRYIEEALASVNETLSFGLYGGDQAQKARDRIAELRAEIAAIQAPAQAATTAVQAVAQATTSVAEEVERVVPSLAKQVEMLAKLSNFTQLTGTELRTLTSAEADYLRQLRDGNLPLEKRIELFERLAKMQPAIAQAFAAALPAGLDTIGLPDVSRMNFGPRVGPVTGAEAAGMVGGGAAREAQRLRVFTGQLETAMAVVEQNIAKQREALGMQVQQQLANNFRENMQRAFGDLFTQFVNQGKISVESVFGALKQMGSSMMGQGISTMFSGVMKGMTPFASFGIGAAIMGTSMLVGNLMDRQAKAEQRRRAREQQRMDEYNRALAQADRTRQSAADWLAGRTGAVGGVLQSVGQVLQETSASRMIGELVAIRIATTRTADAVAGGQFGGAGTTVNVTVQGGDTMGVGEKVAEAVDRLLGTRVQALNLTSGLAVTR